MLHNFSYVAICEDKVLLYKYQIFGIINNQIHKMILLVEIISTRQICGKLNSLQPRS